MIRSPLGQPPGRALDGDAGGAAELQTDVMRFMAILSLCLVAIFALVQSIPAEVPVAGTSATEPVAKTPVAPSAPAPIDPPEDESPPSASLTLAKTEPPATPAPPVDRATGPVRPPAEQADGFTLRFESDAALLALVARQDVGVYAISGAEAQRMSMERGRMAFWPASVPKRFHEMESGTVPRELREALARNGTASPVTWAVTLPGGIARELDRFLSQGSGGELVIAANGRVRLE